jgi:Flp pilus assembly protein TadG
MRQANTRFRRRAEKGSVAVETVLCLPLLILFLVVPLFLARAFWYYSVAQKAAHDSARFLANASQVEMVVPDGSHDEDLPIAALAEAIAHAELDEIKPALVRSTVTITCDLDACGDQVPQTVRASVRLRFSDDLFGAFTSEYFGEDPLLLEARVTMRYVGN